MPIPLDPKRFRRRVFGLLNYEDGLWDILLGSVFLVLSIYPVTRILLGPALNIVLFLAVLAALVGSQLVVRRIISTPRLGVVRVRRTPATVVVLVVTVAMVLATLGLVLATFLQSQAVPPPGPAAPPAWPEVLGGDVVVMLAIALVFSLMAFLFGVRRLYLYGWLIGAGNLASTILHIYAGHTFNLPLAIAAAVIITIGLVLLARFVRRYPFPTEGT